MQRNALLSPRRNATQTRKSESIDQSFQKPRYERTYFHDRANFAIPDIEPWNISISIEHDELGALHVRNIQLGDEHYFRLFGNQLGEKSRTLFAPYPWGDMDKMERASTLAIHRSLAFFDATYLMFLEQLPIAHFALWGIGARHTVNKYDLCVPTLGLAVVDTLHAKGIGKLCIEFLQIIARTAKTDAVELTTAKHNYIATHLYRRSGFQDIGSLRIPLGVDPSTSVSDCRGVKSWRDERHMHYCVNALRNEEVRAFLSGKQRKHMEMGCSNGI